MYKSQLSMEDGPKGIFLIILLLPLLLIYVYFFNNKQQTQPKTTQPINVIKSSSEFDDKKYLESLSRVDYEITQVTKSYKYGSTSKSKPEITASKKVFLNNGLLTAATLNIDNDVLVLYPKENERIYIFEQDKTYYSTSEDQYGNTLLKIADENPILTSFFELTSHENTKKVSEGVYEYEDYIKSTTETTEEQKNSSEYKTVYGQKMIFRYEFDNKTNLLKKFSILSNNRKYLIGLVSYQYKEIKQEDIESVSRIPDGYKKIEE